MSTAQHPNKKEREHMGQPCIAGFYPAFSKNMEAIGLIAPTNLFSSQEKAIGTISQLAGLIKMFGMKVTIRELIVAGTITEKLSVASAYYAAYYLGGAIGSLAIAADGYYACRSGATAAQRLHRIMMLAGGSAIAPMQAFLIQHPEVFDVSSPHRFTYAQYARAPGGK
jgi:hypothetical protein